MDVSENRDTPKSSILIGFSIINHPFWGTPIFGNTHIVISLVFGGVTLLIGALTPLVTVVGGTPCMNSIFFGVPPPENKQRYANVPVK